ncbi:hypothetical protein SAMN04487860_102237 [Ruminococcus flavefaciens]|uniref:Uncharacterized protein n=1 Tax=Ruminococcus flavefaciens TaxID=1265 RepID=A0A1M7HC56_RUMFL|nr:hypothetical protein SAMN04487860_102237 [Ruminococcus flavefaciens]
MIKGVNKKIIEINNPDSLYFEKAVLYVRPNITILPEAVSQKEAQRVLSALISAKQGRNRILKYRRHIIILSLIGIIIAFLLFL